MKKRWATSDGDPMKMVKTILLAMCAMIVLTACAGTAAKSPVQPESAQDATVQNTVADQARNDDPAVTANDNLVVETEPPAVVEQEESSTSESAPVSELVESNDLSEQTWAEEPASQENPK